MTEYPKINGPFFRDMTNKGQFILDRWSIPEFEYLAPLDWEWTEKVDGTNIRVIIRRIKDGIVVDYKGRTDKAILPKPLSLFLEKTFPTDPNFRRDFEMPSYNERYEEILSWMTENNLNEVILYGEGYGPGIQAGGKYRKDQSLVLFDIKIGGFWLYRSAVDEIAQKLGVDSVPVVGYGSLYDAIDAVKSGRKSAWGDFESEGLVVVPKVPLFSRRGSRIITKIKAVDFGS